MPDNTWTRRGSPEWGSVRQPPSASVSLRPMSLAPGAYASALPMSASIPIIDSVRAREVR